MDCGAPNPLTWTTHNNSLDSFIMKSWGNNINTTSDFYIQWIEYTQLTDVREETLLHRGCTHVANWLPSTGGLISVAFKKIVDGENAQLFDFYQVNKYSVRGVAACFCWQL
jgi:hypothetical protein